MNETIFTNSSGEYTTSRLGIFGVETNDVGYYLCSYVFNVRLSEDELRTQDNSVYLFVTDADSLFVKSIPILTAIYGRSCEIDCRPSSSLTTLKLFKIDSSSRKHIQLAYSLDLQTINHHPLSVADDAPIVFNYRKGFFIRNITEDKFICQAHLTIAQSGVDRTSDQNVIIHYTSLSKSQGLLI